MTSPVRPRPSGSPTPSNDQILDCDFLAGCDGSRTYTRILIPEGEVRKDYGRGRTGSSDDLTRRSFPIAKNPFMSAYLSAANRVANTARGKATNEIKRQSKRQTTSMVNAWVDAWTPRSRRSPARKRKSS